MFSFNSLIHYYIIHWLRDLIVALANNKYIYIYIYMCVCGCVCVCVCVCCNIINLTSVIYAVADFSVENK